MGASISATCHMSHQDLGDRVYPTFNPGREKTATKFEREHKRIAPSSKHHSQFFTCLNAKMAYREMSDEEMNEAMDQHEEVSI